MQAVLKRAHPGQARAGGQEEADAHHEGRLLLVVCAGCSQLASITVSLLCCIRRVGEGHAAVWTAEEGDWPAIPRDPSRSPQPLTQGAAGEGRADAQGWGSDCDALALTMRVNVHPCTQEKGMKLFEGRGVTAVEQGRLLLDGDAPPEAFDECLWCTQACAPAWLAETGLPLGARPMRAALLGCICHACACAGRQMLYPEGQEWHAHCITLPCCQPVLEKRRSESSLAIRLSAVQMLANAFS